MSRKSNAARARVARVLVASGVNLDLLGRREPDVYGRETLADLEESLRRHAPALAKVAGVSDVTLTFFQTNDEAALFAKLSEGWDGVLLNAGAWTHTSLALADRLKGLSLPFVEVHLSNLAAREEFRHKSHCAPHAVGVVYGFGMAGYQAALLGLLTKLQA